MLKRMLSLVCVCAAMFAFVAAAPAQETVTHTGEIGEHACASEGRMGPDHAGCAKSCIGRGGDVVLIQGEPGSLELLVLAPNPEDASVYDSLSAHASHTMTITGYESEDEDGHTVFVVTAAEMVSTN